MLQSYFEESFLIILAETPGKKKKLGKICFSDITAGGGRGESGGKHEADIWFPLSICKQLHTGGKSAPQITAANEKSWQSVWWAGKKKNKDEE